MHSTREERLSLARGKKGSSFLHEKKERVEKYVLIFTREMKERKTKGCECVGLGGETSFNGNVSHVVDFSGGKFPAEKKFWDQVELEKKERKKMR